jgi:transposase
MSSLVDEGLDVPSEEPEALAVAPPGTPGRNKRSYVAFRSGGVARASQEALFTPPLPAHALGSDHFVRKLLALVEETLGSTLRSRCLKWGGYPYDPVAMFSVLLYALMLGERSSRKMEELCKYDIRFWYLSGGVTPDHSKFASFRKALDQDGELDRLMMLVVDKAASSGLVNAKNVFVDGTKMPGATSQWRKYLDTVEAADVQESEPPEAPAESPPPASRKRGRKPKDKPPQKPARPCKEPWDKQARTMKTTHGEFLVGYNLQVAVDEACGIVVAAVAINDANDAKALSPVLEAMSKQSKVKPKRVVADSGYDAAENYKTLEQARAKSYISPKRRNTKNPFSPDEHGVLRCLAGHEATKRETVKDGVAYLTHRVSRCKDCPLAKACGQRKPGRQREFNVRSDDHAQSSHQNRMRCASSAGKKLLKCRGQTVEHANARIKRDLRMRRLHLKGLAGARTELLLACLALNLQTILKSLACLLQRRFRAQSAPVPNKKTLHRHVIAMSWIFSPA